MMRQPLALSALVLAAVANAWTPDASCKPFSEIYTDGKHLLEKMWNGAFTYETDPTKGYTMWWTEGGAAGTPDAHENPNDLITQALGMTVPDTCDVAYFHKVGPPTPEGPTFTECHPWHANACCHEATVVTPQALNEAYGSGYQWDRCGPLSRACEAFFVEEACMYECEVNTGLYRAYTDAQHAACSADGVAEGATVTLSDNTTYTCIVGAWGGNDENRWQLRGMPIKASYADAWYRACANDLFPGGEGCDGDMFACAGTYHAQLAAEAVLAAELAANKTRDDAALEAQMAADLQAEKDKGLEAWAIALIVILSLLGLACCIGVVMLVMKEKQGKPMFVNMPAEKDVQMNKA
jgi:folate receptor